MDVQASHQSTVRFGIVRRGSGNRKVKDEALDSQFPQHVFAKELFSLSMSRPVTVTVVLATRLLKAMQDSKVVLCFAMQGSAT